MRSTRRPIILLAAVCAVGAAILPTSMPVWAQTGDTVTAPQHEVAILRVDWNDPEIKRFKAARAAGTVKTVAMSAAGQLMLPLLRLPVLAFDETPQLVRNALGVDAHLVKPRLVISDPNTPIWYHIVDDYGDVSITVDADLRVNQSNDSDFRMHKRPLSMDGLKQGGKTRISIFDGARDEGMEGVMVEYTVHKFPDIPYTVTIECRGQAKPQCRDLPTITKDQELLRVVAAQ